MVLLRSLITHGKIRITHAKAKAIQPTIDSLVTSIKKDTSAGIRHVRSVLVDEQSVQKLVEMTKGQLNTRSSGYTRILRLGPRRGDGAEEVLLEFVDKAVEAPKTKTKTKTKTIKDQNTVQEAEIVTPKKSKTRKQST